jgi:hypothetical protein
MDVLQKGNNGKCKFGFLYPQNISKKLALNNESNMGIGYKHDWGKTHSKDSQIHLFLHFSHDLFHISPFFHMSNEIILF